MSNNRLEQLQAYLKGHPKDTFTRFAIALEYIKLQQDEAALPYFNSLIEQYPDYVGTYYHLGKLYERAGDRKQAAGIYQQGMAVAQKAGDGHSREELLQAHSLLKDADIDE